MSQGPTELSAGNTLVSVPRSWDDRDCPVVEVEFRKAVERSRDRAWADYLGGDGKFNQTLLDHREVLKLYRNRF